MRTAWNAFVGGHGMHVKAVKDACERGHQLCHQVATDDLGEVGIVWAIEQQRGLELKWQVR